MSSLSRLHLSGKESLPTPGLANTDRWTQCWMLHIPEEGICSPSGSTAWRENIVDLRDFSSQWDQTKLERKTSRKWKKIKRKRFISCRRCFQCISEIWEILDQWCSMRFYFLHFQMARLCTSPKVPCTLRICEVKEGKGKVPELALVVRHVDKVVVTSGTVGTVEAAKLGWKSSQSFAASSTKLSPKRVSIAG